MLVMELNINVGYVDGLIDVSDRQQFPPSLTFVCP